MANWNDLPDEIKMLIIKKMKFTTRNKLKMCSRLDRVMVNNIPLKFGDVHTLISKNELSMSVNDSANSILFQIKNSEPNTLEVVFNGTTRYIPYSTFEEGRQIVNQYAISFLATIFYARNVEIGDFITGIAFPIEFMNAINKPKCDRIEVRYSSSVNIKNWMEHFTTTEFIIDELSSPDEIVDDPDTLDMLMNYDWLDMEVPNGLTDDHLMNFNGRVIWLGSSNVTSIGINSFIKKVIADDDQNSKMIDFGFEMKDKLWWNEVIQEIRCKHFERNFLGFEHEITNGKYLYLTTCEFRIVISKKKNFE